MRRLSTTPRLFIILSLLPLLLTSMIALTPAAPVATAEEKTEANADADGSGNVGDNGGEVDAGADPTGQSLQEPVYTAAPLPTVQIDGVAWGQLVVGDVVYVVGSFNSARPERPRGSRRSRGPTSWPTTSIPGSSSRTSPPRSTVRDEAWPSPRTARPSTSPGSSTGSTTSGTAAWPLSTSPKGTEPSSPPSNPCSAPLSRTSRWPVTPSTSGATSPR